MNAILEKVEVFRGRILGISRYWNNSMGFYEDSLSVWNPETCETETVPIGVDVFDATVIDRDIENGPYAEQYAKSQERQREEWRKNEAKRLCELFQHHGEQTAEKLAIWFQENNERMGIRKLEKLLQTICRSKFKLSLQEQTIRWILNPAERKYGWPLSERQMDCV